MFIYITQNNIEIVLILFKNDDWFFNVFWQLKD